jgi:hypothetical protein
VRSSNAPSRTAGSLVVDGGMSRGIAPVIVPIPVDPRDPQSQSDRQAVCQGPAVVKMGAPDVETAMAATHRRVRVLDLRCLAMRGRGPQYRVETTGPERRFGWPEAPETRISPRYGVGQAARSPGRVSACQATAAAAADRT